MNPIDILLWSLATLAGVPALVSIFFLLLITLAFVIGILMIPFTLTSDKLKKKRNKL